jgi:hypothetical protein
MKALCTCLLVLMVGVALTVALAASGQNNVGAQSSYCPSSGRVKTLAFRRRL